MIKISVRLLRPGWRYLKAIWCRDIRTTLFVDIIKPNGYYQVSTFTEYDRYPLLFQKCSAYLGHIQHQRILSYGCSTGEEVHTLGSYLPGATIVGTDINKWCIRQCRQKYQSPNFFFYHRRSDDFDACTGFDAIFCMAVFQRTQNRTNNNNMQAEGIMFKQFENEIILLDGKLNIGGLLIIDFADFSFSDTICADRYAPLEFDGNNLVRNRPLFDKNNQKIAEINNNYRVFIKQSA